MENTLNLRRSTDRKTTPSAARTGKTANVSNAFGILSGREFSCPGQTSACESVCYAGKLETLFPGFRNVMQANWDALKDASYLNMAKSLYAIIQDFKVEATKRNADFNFRIHHDGDFFSRQYAAAWATVIRANPDVQFWAYTRSFTDKVNVVDILAELPNLTLYLSVDNDNAAWAEIIREEYPNILLATLTETFADGIDMMRSLGQDRPGAACPELKGAIPLITINGGACQSCQLCIKGKANIRFASKGK